MADDTSAPAGLHEEAQEAEGLGQLLSLKDGDTFLVADDHGDIVKATDGLFDHDTRLLSRFRLLIGGRPPSRLSSSVSKDNVQFLFHGCNRPLPRLGHKATPPGVIHIERRRLLWRSRLFEQIRLVNYSLADEVCPLSLELDADFRDMFEIRGTPRASRGETRRPTADGRRISFSYLGLDGRERSCIVEFSEPPARLAAHRADFMLGLCSGGAFELFVEAGPVAEAIPTRERYRAAAASAVSAMRARRRRGGEVRARGRHFNDWLRQSRADLALLTADLPTGPYPYAGVPWFSTPFGRDGLITAWQTLWLNPSLAKGVLSYLASRQATAVSAFRDSAPGKIMHETRRGEMANLGEVPFGLYYGGVDSTPLFVALAGAYAARTGDLDFIRTLWPNLTAAIGWLEDFGDSDGDGLIDYARGAGTGLANQGWKDSEDSIFHADGRFPSGPIALVEVQGYAFAAYRAMAELGGRLDDPRAGGWAAKGEAMRQAVEARFWMEDQGFYGVAIDGEGALCRTLTSNAGHLLFVGLPAPQRAKRVIATLCSPAFMTGWGLRTLAQGQARYNPMSYHNGSVWPHDTAICAAGMSRYGHRREAALVLEHLLEAARHFSMRLPELFCGFPRNLGQPPIAYPVACLPQAWAASSVFMLLQACLGIEIDGWNGQLRLDEPCLPAGIVHLFLSKIGVDGKTVDLDIRE
ncbi:MAG: amylo-alpha-1,6-glucosidase [Caulobacteraceae bacterium]|nr:amylo-alpha-1,6-glucosidase [Caulobacteraceae bacterium]